MRNNIEDFKKRILKFMIDTTEHYSFKEEIHEKYKCSYFNIGFIYEW